MKNSKISIQFLGAAGTVTGSKHLLKTPEKNILIDCGLFQGLKTLRMKNWDSLPVDIKTIDILILTHAHLDHCGYIPLLVRNGFKGKVLMTPPTRDLTEIILRDSAKIQEEDTRKANEGGYTKYNPALPLYTVKDVEVALKQFETKKDIEWIKLSENISFRFVKNGHILGSAFVEMKCFGRIIVFSGDIGRTKNLLLAAPSIIEKADCLIMESTYGDRLHPSTNPADEIQEIILHTLEKNGNLLIPSFAVERAQEIMFIINQLKEEKKIPDIPIYLDSPMGADATDIFLNYTEWHKMTPRQIYTIYKNIQIIREFSETLKQLENKHLKIIIAASGMLDGGRVLTYLSKFGGSAKNTILLVGFQGEGTRGRALKEGVKELQLHGKFYQIKAEVKNIESMSAHADQLEMISWMKNFKEKPKQLFLIHGEPTAQKIFKTKIKAELGIDAIIPQLNDEFPIN